jgi:hypothetical protein
MTDTTLRGPNPAIAAAERGRDRVLVALLKTLKQQRYAFTTPTPATHNRVIARNGKFIAHDVRDALGWSLPFSRDILPDDLFNLIYDAGLLIQRGKLFVSRYRVSTLGEDLVLHSGFPAIADDAVFFGPDTYRFASFIQQELRERSPGGLMADIGAGSGAGSIVAAKIIWPDRIILTDNNPTALELARVNTQAADIAAIGLITDGLNAVGDGIDVILANPPYISGDGRVAYRDGSDMHFARRSLEWALAGAAKLAPGGILLMYTGSAIFEGGADPFRNAVEDQLQAGLAMTYRELDPDIFGGQLQSPAYDDVERIAAVGLTIRRPA